MSSRASQCLIALAVLPVAASFPVPLWGQFTSQIEGTVMDPSRAAIPSAKLTLLNTNTGIETNVVAGPAGYFRFASLPASSFKVTAIAPGFRPTEVSDLRLEGGETRTVNITLEVGATSSAVTVAAEASAVELSEARVSSVVESRQFNELPLLGRNLFGLVALTPGVTGTTGLADVFGSEQQVNVNAAGQRGEQNGYAVDSGSVTSMVRHGRVNLQPNSESIQEMRVSVNNFSAEQGNDAGASINVVTKSGSNNWHGSASWFHWNNKLHSRNVIQTSLPVFRRNEGAASLGGPIVRNRTFIFGSYALLRQSTAAGGAATVETPEFVNYVASRFPNNKSTLLMQKFKPAARPVQNFRTAGFYAGVNCAGQGDIPTPIGTLPCSMPLTGEGITGYTSPRSGYQWNTRIDHMLTSNDRLYFNGYRNSEKSRLGSTTRPDFNVEFPILNWYGNVNWTRTISPARINEARVNVVRVHGEIYCAQCDIPSGINVTGAMSGWGSGGPTPFIQNNYHYNDVLSWIKGTHSMKMGFSLSKLQSNWKPTASYQRPNYTFNNIFDFTLDTPFSQGNIGLNPVDGSVYTPDVAERQTVVSAFFEDSWKVTRNLTVTLGLRWETYGKVGQATLGNNVEFRSGNDFRSRIADGKNVTSENILKSADNNNFAPRISFAWDPAGRGKTAIRGGAGIFYDFLPSQLYGGAHYTPPIYMIITASQQTAPLLPRYEFGKSASDPYQFPRPLGLEGVIGLDARNGSSFARSNIVWIDPSLRNSYTYNYSFGVQHALNSTLTFEANYIGNTGRKLYSKYNVNRYTGDLIENNGVLKRLNPSFGNIDYSQSNLGSIYHGGTFALRQRYSNGLLFQVAYTAGKVIDYGSSFSGGAVNPIDTTNWRPERGLADHQVGQKLALSAVWEVPGPATGVSQAILGGWQLSGIAILQAGRPHSITCSTPFRPVRTNGVITGNTGCDYNADGVTNDRPNAPSWAAGTIAGRSTSERLTGIFARSDFPAPALGGRGTLGRNTYFNAGLADTNFSLARNFHIPWFTGSEPANLQVRADAFNAFNRVNLGGIVSNMDSANFGRVTSASEGRRFQFGLRLSF
ncbi:MAG: carboxypeptidase regulatory-like domain-containing protein [Bryobacteraceae bacterium]